jgi:hypothetical protein
MARTNRDGCAEDGYGFSGEDHLKNAVELLCIDLKKYIEDTAREVLSTYKSDRNTTYIRMREKGFNLDDSVLMDTVADGYWCTDTRMVLLIPVLMHHGKFDEPEQSSGPYIDSNTPSARCVEIAAEQMLVDAVRSQMFKLLDELADYAEENGEESDAEPGDASDATEAPGEADAPTDEIPIDGEQY